MSIDVVRSYVARLMNSWETTFFQLRRPQREGESCNVRYRYPPGQECPDGYNHVALDLDYYSPQFQLDQNMWPHHKDKYRVCDLRIEKGVNASTTFYFWVSVCLDVKGRYGILRIGEFIN